GILIPGRLPPSSTTVGIELVAKNREEPRFQVGTGREHVSRLPSFYQCLLGQVVCSFLIATQRAREGAQERNQVQQIMLELGIVVSFVPRPIGGLRPCFGVLRAYAHEVPPSGS